MKRKDQWLKTTMTIAALMLSIALCSTPSQAQQKMKNDNMANPQEMMMRQMSMRNHQNQGDSTQSNQKTGSNQDGHMPFMNGMMGMPMRGMMRGKNMGLGKMPNMMPMIGFANGQEGNFAAYEQFINKTRELRRTLNNKRFDFREAFWIPETTIQELRDMSKEINDLQQELQNKMPVQAPVE